MSTNTSPLEQRITRLEDVEAIRRLKALYCEVCDDDHNPDRIVSLFTEDGTWESTGSHGAHNGHGSIQSAFAGFRDLISFSQHNVTNLVVDVADDGKSAQGTWHFCGLLKHGDNEAFWALARYEETYRKSKGRWLIHHLRAVRLGYVPASGFEGFDA
ncbi:nuclear transport factor 2 family protein [Rhodococcus rhodochrous]|uniref:nuclear transport factor 2 family protein n=1 Tax=Rhodococcus rhodochrous TaxID=1829 RepID=UPI001E4A1ACE|nr:nuclear transport factor 2 family protein [Rhodococcus rhodochrous]MCB8914005.1 nuclear transport factor 2 family protein [Rhodococcus rhodochrous]